MIGRPRCARLQDGGIDADADIGVAGFDLLQGRAGGEGVLGHDPMGSRGRRRASRISAPSFLRAHCTAAGRVVCCGVGIAFFVQYSGYVV